MKSGRVAKLASDQKVVVILNVDDEVYESFETTGEQLVKGGFGGLIFRCENLESDTPIILARNPNEFNSIRAVILSDHFDVMRKGRNAERKAVKAKSRARRR